MASEPWTVPLVHILRQRRWQTCPEPFFHVVAYDVFTPEIYSWMANAHAELLARGLSETPTRDKLSRNIPNYDAYGFPLTSQTPAPFNVFASREWHDVLANLIGVRATGDINAGFHHHTLGSKNGLVHNDFNPGWFADASDQYGINFARNDICEYSTGRVPDSRIRTHQTVRAIAVLFYLNNPPWRPGDGGGTGLYAHRGQPVEEPSKVIPPINNSLFLFECRPNSFHTFLSNRNGPRNSLIMWLHRPLQDAESRWGSKAIVQWTNAPRSQA